MFIVCLLVCIFNLLAIVHLSLWYMGVDDNLIALNVGSFRV